MVHTILKPAVLTSVIRSQKHHKSQYLWLTRLRRGWQPVGFCFTHHQVLSGELKAINNHPNVCISINEYTAKISIF